MRLPCTSLTTSYKLFLADYSVSLPAFHPALDKSVSMLVLRVENFTEEHLLQSTPLEVGVAGSQMAISALSGSLCGREWMLCIKCP